MTFYIINENQSISAMEAIKQSQKMMYGHKWRYVRLSCRFFGWFILSILTCGIGFFWLNPYIGVSRAEFYKDLKINS